MQERTRVSGEASSNGAVQAKTKKNPALAKTPKVRFAKTPKRLTGGGRIRKVQLHQLETTRPASQSLVEGYDSDTRGE